MNKIRIIVFILILVILFVIIKIFILDAAKDEYCITQSREKFRGNTGKPSTEQLKYFNMCLKDMSFIDTVKLKLK